MKFLAVVAILLAVNSASAFWTACPGIAAPTRVASGQCTAAGCTVTRGSSLVAECDFVPTAAHGFLETRMTATVLGTQISLPIDDIFINACDHLRGRSCPTTAGQTHTWDWSLTVPTTFPQLSNVPFRVELVDRNTGANVVCFTVQATIN
ncbi:CLUMA_CG017687, isoform A [Clunio marinus]|uniref:CLUMA_CG017687, isoform A n=1 Tax=Clunio marinus TaxID=568069 RepID=A0A1J1IWF6_9DIPT|nr:CLUMA_CG017687, isoform A [Clunio marinus]